MAGAEPEERVVVPSLRQRWLHATFLHWRYDRRDVQRLVPSVLAVEELDGSAWVGMVLFDTAGTKVGGFLPMPGGRRFPETNVRTYVRLPDGRDAVWFLTLEVGSPLLAAVGRALLKLPYVAARMSVAHRADGCWVYRSERPDGTGHHAIVRPRGPCAPVPADGRASLLTGRWRAAVPRSPGRLEVPVGHATWPLRGADLVTLDETLLASVGLPVPTSPPEVVWSSGVDADVGLPRPPRGRRARP